MRMAVAATALGLTLLTAAALAACTPEDPGGPPSPGPSTTPVFASDEEALAAAEEVYGAYQAVADELGGSGWEDPSILQDVARGKLLADELTSAASFNELGYTQQGSTTFDSLTLQQLRDSGPGTVLITVYLCVDVSSVDVIDSEGVSIVSSSRPDRQPVEIDIDDVDGTFKISRSEAWTGQDFC